MRNMAGWLIDQCVFDESLGGFATFGLADAEDYITGPIVRHEDKWPSSTTFFSLQVWNDDDDLCGPGWNPGDMDTDVADDIVASLEAAIDRYPRGSAARANVVRNFEYFQAVHHRMTASNYDNWWRWLPQWGPPPLITSLNINTTNSSVDLVYSSSVSERCEYRSEMSRAEEQTNKP